MIKTDEDEHQLIATYCKILTSNNNEAASVIEDVDQRLDCLEREAVEALLQQLKEENSRLETEYKELAAHSSTAAGAEARSLRQQRSRLEARMAILEDHNRQLEAQLERLRQLVAEPGGTLQVCGSLSLLLIKRLVRYFPKLVVSLAHLTYSCPLLKEDFRNSVALCITVTSLLPVTQSEPSVLYAKELLQYAKTITGSM